MKAFMECGRNELQVSVIYAERSAPVANRITATESLTKKACNGLLQQNRPKADTPATESRGSYWG
jgi:hypothetical protein